jgi:hypothetical protein
VKGIFTDEGADLLWNVLRFVTKRPEVHNQETWMMLPNEDTIPTAEKDWSCGTTACIAGWATLFAGWKPRIEQSPQMVPIEGCTCDYCEGRTSAYPPVQISAVEKDGEVRPLSTVAAALLVGEGAPDAHVRMVASELFSASARLDEIWTLAERNSDGYIHREEVEDAS